MEREEKNAHFEYYHSENNISDKYNFNKNSCKKYDRSDSDSNLNVILKRQRDCCHNKAFIVIISFGIIAYA